MINYAHYCPTPFQNWRYKYKYNLFQPANPGQCKPKTNASKAPTQPADTWASVHPPDTWAAGACLKSLAVGLLGARVTILPGKLQAEIHPNKYQWFSVF